jgi:5-methyltetrahydrofolate--homocysteine methyltransferase
MDIGIVNAGRLPLYSDIDEDLRELLTKVILNKTGDNECVEELIAYAEKEKERIEAAKAS